LAALLASQPILCKPGTKNRAKNQKNRAKTGDRQIIANIFLNGVEIVPSRSFKGMEGSSGASRTIQPRRRKCDILMGGPSLIRVSRRQNPVDDYGDDYG
jgi:hypothetical protein